LWEQGVRGCRESRAEKGAESALIHWNTVRQFSGGREVAIEERNEGAARILACCFDKC
jgi:hypothetical protein